MKRFPLFGFEILEAFYENSKENENGRKRNIRGRK